jgi:hypothetical protein
MAVNIKIAALKDVTPWCLINKYQLFEATYCLNIQAAVRSKTSVPVNQVTRRHILDHCKFNNVIISVKHSICATSQFAIGLSVCQYTEIQFPSKALLHPALLLRVVKRGEPVVIHRAEWGRQQHETQIQEQEREHAKVNRFLL